MKYRIVSLSIAICCTHTTMRTFTLLPTKEALVSYARQCAVAPALVCAAQMVHRIQNRIGFLPTMLTGQLATLAFISWQQQKKQIVEPLPSAEQPCKIGYLHLSGTVTSTDKFHEALKKCLDDAKVKGIILKIDAEWGNLSICQTMFKELKRAAQQKPLIALVEKSCCREPYLIATAAHCIIANEHSTVGMIGTTACFTEIKLDPSRELYYFYAGKLTPLGDTHHHLTPPEHKLIAEQLELHYQQMCATISEQRNLALDTLDSWAEGKPFFGMQALEAHLIDRIGTLSDAHEVMEELLKSKNISLGKFEPISYSI